MKKIIRLTESDLTNLVKRVIQEQATEKLIQSAPSKQSVGKITNTVGKTDSNSWFSYFPCLNEVPQSKRPIVNGNVILKTGAGGQQFTLLPQSGKSDPLSKRVAQYKPVDGMIGQVKGGGVYYCSSEAYAKGFGPQIMK
jgi:hypothetical protein